MTSPASTVYLVLGYCDDYYCDSMHPVGVFDRQEAAMACMNERFGFSVLPLELNRERTVLEWRGYDPEAS